VRASPMRSFDPRAVGALECRAWVTYYRREWLAFLLSAVRLVRHTAGRCVRVRAGHVRVRDRG
ncbi:MAG TPA: hypothetical protein VHN80_26040, partial [Kineosporiaceae bacterium]|nr:hypothetical protein [Kineosporiaceae bacterium]